MVAGPGDRQQVARHGAPDRGVPERDGVAGLDQEPVRQRLAAARPQVGVEHAIALARSGHRAWRGAGRVDLERGGDRRQLGLPERTVGQRQQAQDPAAFLGADREAGDDQLVERARQRGARQLAAGGQELLGDERQAAGSFGDEEQQAGRRPFALDPLDEGGQLVAIERRQGQALRRARTGRDRPDVGRPRVVAADDVGLVRADDRQALFARDPRQERDERPRGGIGLVQVLDDEDDRMLLAQPTEQPEDPFQRSCLAPFRGGRSAAGDRGADLDQPRLEIGQQPDDLGRGRTEQTGEDIRRQVAQGRADRPDDGAVRLVGAGRPGGRAQDGHRLAQRAHPLDGLVEETGDPDARGATQQQGPGHSVRGVVESPGEAARMPLLAPRSACSCT